MYLIPSFQLVFKAFLWLNYKLNKLTFNYHIFYFTIRALKFAQGQDSWIAKLQNGLDFFPLPKSLLKGEACPPPLIRLGGLSPSLVARLNMRISKLGVPVSFHCTSCNRARKLENYRLTVKRYRQSKDVAYSKNSATKSCALFWSF